MIIIPKTNSLGGVLHLSKVKGGVITPILPAVHNDILRNFATKIINGNVGWEDLLYFKFGRSGAANTTTTTTLVDPIVKGGKYWDEAASITQEPSVTSFDPVTRVYRVEETFKSLLSLGWTADPIREVGYDYWSIDQNATVTARIVLPTPVTLASDEQLLVEYRLIGEFQLPPAKYNAVVTMPSGDVATEISFFHKPTATIKQMLLPANAMTMSYAYYTSNSWNLVNTDETTIPPRKIPIDSLSMDVEFELGLSEGTGAAIGIFQLTENYTYVVDPKIPKTNTMKLLFRVRNDYSSIPSV